MAGTCRSRWKCRAVATSSQGAWRSHRRGSSAARAVEWTRPSRPSNARGRSRPAGQLLRVGHVQIDHRGWFGQSSGRSADRRTGRSRGTTLRAILLVELRHREGDRGVGDDAGTRHRLPASSPDMCALPPSCSVTHAPGRRRPGRPRRRRRRRRPRQPGDHRGDLVRLAIRRPDDCGSPLAVLGQPGGHVGVDEAGATTLALMLRLPNSRSDRAGHPDESGLAGRVLTCPRRRPDRPPTKNKRPHFARSILTRRAWRSGGTVQVGVQHTGELLRTSAAAACRR